MRMRPTFLLSAAVALAAASISILSCTQSPSSGVQTGEPSGPTIKDAYKGHYLIGTAGDVPGGFSNEELQLVKRNFNIITPENYFKPAPIHPLEDVWAFARPDALVKWCNDNHVEVHAHTLMWHSQTANWFFQRGNGETDAQHRETVIARLRNHITTLVGRYKGKIHSWDVVNEAINDGGSPDTENLRNSDWFKAIGPDFLTMAFKFAHEADPDAKLYYNDYNIEGGSKHQNSLVLLKRLIKDGAPIYGVGIQGHWSTNGLNYAAVDKAISDYATLGLHVSISELDVTIAGATGGQIGGAAGGGRGGGRGGRGAGGGQAPVVNPVDAVTAGVPDLSDDQKAKVAQIASEQGPKLAQWQKSSQAALLAFAPQYQPSQVAYAHEMEEYTAEQAKQNALRDDIFNESEARVLGVLTPAQAQAWEADRVKAQFSAQFGTLNLTDAQKAKVDSLSADAGRKLAAARSKNAVADAKAGFTKNVTAILDEAQTAQYQASRTTVVRRPTPPAPSSAAGLKAQADAYAHLFEIFEKHVGTMDRITFWGLNDARSWRAGQNPLLFDANNQPKPAIPAILNVLHRPVTALPAALENPTRQ